MRLQRTLMQLVLRTTAEILSPLAGEMPCSAWTEYGRSGNPMRHLPSVVAPSSFLYETIQETP
jgi:hypothetical protein